jgi:hypothetical protein
MPDLEGVIWYRAGIDKFVNLNGKILGVWNDNLHLTIVTDAQPHFSQKSNEK